MIRLLRRYLRPYRGQLAVVAVLLLGQAIGNLMLPSLNADIINTGVLRGDTGYILRTGGLMLGVTLALVVAAVITVYFGARTAMSLGRDLRAAMFRTVEGFSLREVNQFGAPSLITRNTNDAQQVQMFVLMALTFMFSAPITAVGGVLMALRENVTLSGLLLVILPLLIGVVALVMRAAIPLFRSVQSKLDRINRVMQENLAGVRVIRAFVRTESEQRRFAEANADLTGTLLRVNRVFALTMPSLMLIFNLSTVAIVWFGGHLVDGGDMPIGNLTAFLSYIMQILFSVMMAVMMVVMVPRAAASAERIQEVLDTVPAVQDPPPPSADDSQGAAASAVLGDGSAEAPWSTPASITAEPREPREPDAWRAGPPTDAVLGQVRFENVEFGYPGAEDPVLRGVSATFPTGRTTAIVGGTGAGKTTLVNLIPRLYDVTGGAVLLDGADVRSRTQEELRSSMGLVPQRAFLFRGTVASNLRFGREEATDEELWHALEVAQARDFVEALPEGLEAVIDQGGTNLSGGQRQRMAIARAVVRRPRLFVFDDSFSALDNVTDSRLRAALRAETREATVIIVAQRVSTILDADQIVVLDGGQVVGAGTHEELLVSCPTYEEIVASQLNGARAA